MGNFKHILCVSILFTIGCGGGSVSVIPSTESSTIEGSTINEKMDVLWVVDCSGSMNNEIDNVQRNAMSFVKDYLAYNYDFRIGIISTTAWSQKHYDYELSGASNPDFNNTYVDSTLNPYLPILNVLHSGEASDQDTMSPYLSQSDITQADRDALDIDFCDCTYTDNNMDGDVTDPGEKSCEDPVADSCTDLTSYVTANPNSFLNKFRVNFDIYGRDVGKKNCGSMSPSPENWTNANDSTIRFVADERGIDSVTSFISTSDISKNLIETNDNSTPYWANFYGRDYSNAGASTFFRDDAFLAVIFITDERDHSRKRGTEVDIIPHNYGSGAVYTGASELTDYLTLFKGSSEFYKIYSITKWDENNDGDPGEGYSFSTFQSYHDLAKSTEGILVSIDKPDYSEDLKAITANIIEASTTFPVEGEPVLSTLKVIFDRNTAQEVDVPVYDPNDANSDGGYIYNETGKIITFHGDYIPTQGIELSVTYDRKSL